MINNTFFKGKVLIINQLNKKQIDEFQNNGYLILKNSYQLKPSKP